MYFFHVLGLTEINNSLWYGFIGFPRSYETIYILSFNFNANLFRSWYAYLT